MINAAVGEIAGEVQLMPPGKFLAEIAVQGEHEGPLFVGEQGVGTLVGPEHLAECGSCHGVLSESYIRADGIATALIGKSAQGVHGGHGSEVPQAGSPQAGGSVSGHFPLFVCRTGKGSDGGGAAPEGICQQCGIAARQAGGGGNVQLAGESEKPGFRIPVQDSAVFQQAGFSGEMELLFQGGVSGDFSRLEQVQREGLGTCGNQSGADVYLNGRRSSDRQGSHGCVGIGVCRIHPGAEGGCSVDGKCHSGAFFKCQAIEAGRPLNLQTPPLPDGDGLKGAAAGKDAAILHQNHAGSLAAVAHPALEGNVAFQRSAVVQQRVFRHGDLFSRQIPRVGQS